MAIQPNLKWYTEISARKKVSPRCPFASVYRCPRYYQSVSLLGKSGMTTSIESEEDKELLEKWKRSDLWPVVDEQATSVMGPEREPRHFGNFCPEVSFDRFGWFSSHLVHHWDEIDSDVARSSLKKEGAPPDDWRWQWVLISSMHYTDCPLYSPLQLGVNDSKNKGPIGFRR